MIEKYYTIVHFGTYRYTQTTCSDHTNQTNSCNVNDLVNHINSANNFTEVLNILELRLILSIIVL